MAKLVILIILMNLTILVSFRILGILVKMVVLVLLVNMVVWHSFCLKLRDDSVLVVKFWYGKLCLFKIKEMVGRWINSAASLVRLITVKKNKLRYKFMFSLF